VFSSPSSPPPPPSPPPRSPEHRQELGNTLKDPMTAVERASEITGVPIVTAKRSPCGTCPYRDTNCCVETALTPADGAHIMWQGKGQGGNRDGLPMLCHCGRNTKGAVPIWTSRLSEYRQCTGAQVLQQREALRYHEHGDSVIDATPSRGQSQAKALSEMKTISGQLASGEIGEETARAEIAGLGASARARPARMTRRGIARTVERMMGHPISLDAFRQLPRAVVLARAHPAISDSHIVHPDLEPPRPGEFKML
jgi:hypothetical protein